MSTTTHPLAQLPRRARLVELPDGGSVHVRSLTLGELRRIDARTGELPDVVDRAVKSAELLAAAALVDADGAPMFGPEPTDDDLAAIAFLTPEQIEAIGAAAVRSKTDAKKS